MQGANATASAQNTWPNAEQILHKSPSFSPRKKAMGVAELAAAGLQVPPPQPNNTNKPKPMKSTFYAPQAELRERLNIQDPRIQVMEEVYEPVPGAKAGETETNLNDYISYGSALMGDFKRKVMGRQNNGYYVETVDE